MPSIFLDFQLPNATTWFYFSFLLAIALFFKFRRFWSMRNWDIVSLFVLVPGFLLLQQAGPQQLQGLAKMDPVAWAGYVWLLSGSTYFFARCHVDLALVRRPALTPNLNPGGLTWLACALFVCLVSVAVRLPERTGENTVGRKSLAQEAAEKSVETTVGDVAGEEALQWVHRILAVACHLAVVAGIGVVGWRHFQDPSSGIAAATCYLLLPYTALHVGQLAHVWPSALLVWSVVFYRRPVLTGWLLGMATGGAYYPVVTIPVWLSFYKRRGAGRFALSFAIAAGVMLFAVALKLSLQNDLATQLKSAWSLADWQAWKAPITESFWLGIPWAYRLPVFIAYIAFVITTAFWPMPKNLAHVLALSAASLIGVQFWYADQGGVYVLWYMPMLLLMIFRPNLSECVPPAQETEPGKIAAAGKLALGSTLKMLRGPEPVARVH
jgi:hypothetical protein